jgi:hypothetical protein
MTLAKFLRENVKKPMGLKVTQTDPLCFTITTGGKGAAKLSQAFKVSGNLITEKPPTELVTETK